MKKIEAFIRPEASEQVKRSLETAGATGMSLSDVKGQGEQKGIEYINRTSKYRVDLSPKIRFELVVEDEEVDRFVDAIISTASTGEVGDGEIFISEVERRIRIRMGERNPLAR